MRDRIALALLVLAALLLSAAIYAATRPEPPKPRPAPISIQFCQDWRDRQPSPCHRIPFRKEYAI